MGELSSQQLLTSQRLSVRPETMAAMLQLTRNCRISADETEIKANLTNLSLKGIIGIKAMSEISAALNQIDDFKSFAVCALSQSQISSPPLDH